VQNNVHPFPHFGEEVLGLRRGGCHPGDFGMARIYPSL